MGEEEKAVAVNSGEGQKEQQGLGTVILFEALA